MDESQPSNTPSGSWRLDLNAVKAWISDNVSTLRCALVEMAVKYATVMKKKKMKVAVAMSVGIVCGVMVCV